MITNKEMDHTQKGRKKEEEKAREDKLREKGDKERGEITEVVEEVSLETDKRGEKMLIDEKDEGNKEN